MRTKLTSLAVLLAAHLVARGADFTLGPVISHLGQQDGSAGIAAGAAHFISTTDENNTLRLYTDDGSGAARDLLSLDPHLGFKPKDNGQFRECDLEGAARIGDTIYWIASHGRNSSAEVRIMRRVFCATTIVGTGADTTLTFTGQPCKTLLDTLLADARLADFKLKEAAEKAPETEGGFNIESLCADGDRLLLGFRNPMSERGALIVPLNNPAKIVAGEKPDLGDPIALKLGGLGIRDMTRWRDGYLIVAGDWRDRTAAGAQPSRLFTWSGKSDAAPALLTGDLADLNPEAAFTIGEGFEAKLMLLSDDGGGAFRSVTVSFTAP